MSMQEVFIKSTVSAVRDIRFYPAQMMIKMSDDEGTTKVDLGYASSRLLELLVSKAGKVVERDEILQYAWNGRVVSQNNLNQAIKLLREVLGDVITKEVVQTVPRRGYMFNPDYLLRDDAFEIDCPSIEVTDSLPTLPQYGEDPQGFFISPTGRNYSFFRTRWKETILGILCLSQFFLINAQLEYDLIFSGTHVVREVWINNNHVIYVADDSALVLDLERRFSERISRLSDMPIEHSLVVLNKMHDFYEISCLSAAGKARAIYVYSSRLDSMTDEEFSACLL